jgi:hypothetical protein
MAQKTVAPYATADILVPYGQKIAISTNGGGIVTIWYQTAPGISPSKFYIHDRISNEEILLGTFATDQVVRIDTKGNPALYDVTTSPTVGVGDADTLKGYSPDTTDTASTIVLRDTSGDIQTNALESTVTTGTAPLTVASTTVVTNLNADMVDGISSASFLRSDAADSVDGPLTFTIGPVLNNTISISIKESGGTAREILTIDGSNIFQVGVTNNATNIKSNGTLSIQSASVYMDNNRAILIDESGGTARDVLYVSPADIFSTGNSNLTTNIRSNGTLQYNSAALPTGTIDTTAVQTITVTDGFITAIA